MWSHVLCYFSVTPSIVCTELEHPPPAAATYRAGDATLPRGHVQIPPSKHFQKSSRFFSHWIWVRPPLGSKLAPQHFQPRLKNAAKWTVRAAGASPRPSREIANDETANSERAFVAQWSPTLNNMLQKETKYLSMMATSSQGGKKEERNVPLVDWTIGHHPQGVREWATSPSGPRDVGTRRPTAERWISGDVRWQQIEARDTGSSLSSSIMPCFKSSSIIEYLVIIVIINHLKNATQQEHLHVQYVGGQMLWSQYILQLILCTGPLSDIVDKSHLLIDKKNSKWTWLKNYSQFHLLNWKGCSSPPISQHLLSHTWSRVKDLFLGTFLLLWLWCPLFPSESLGLAPFLLSSHSSCDPRLGKLCRQFTCMGANRTCVILRHSSRPSSSYNGGFLSNSLDNFGQARSPWTT